MVAPRHCKVYKKFGFIEISDIKLDAEADNAESILMILKLKENGKFVHYPFYDSAFEKLKDFLPILNDSLAKHQKLKDMYKVFLSNNLNLKGNEYCLLNFRSFLINSYLHKAQIELESQSSYEKEFMYRKLFEKLLEYWPHHYLDQLRQKVVELKNSCCDSQSHELSLSHVS